MFLVCFFGAICLFHLIVSGRGWQACVERGGDDMQQRSPAHEFISILVKRCGQTTSWKNENINTVFVREKPILELIVFDSFKIRKRNHLEKKKKSIWFQIWQIYLSLLCTNFNRKWIVSLLLIYLTSAPPLSLWLNEVSSQIFSLCNIMYTRCLRNMWSTISTNDVIWPNFKASTDTDTVSK